MVSPPLGTLIITNVYCVCFSTWIWGRQVPMGGGKTTADRRTGIWGTLHVKTRENVPCGTWSEPPRKDLQLGLNTGEEQEL